LSFCGICQQGVQVGVEVDKGLGKGVVGLRGDWNNGSTPLQS